MARKAAYHPDKNPTLPPVRTVADINRLPWGGNAWWDLPIIQHTDTAMLDETIKYETRHKMCDRAGYLMTGEDCTSTDKIFDAYLMSLRMGAMRKSPSVKPALARSLDRTCLKHFGKKAWLSEI